ncbi:hypothetical protein SLEP1_g57490 [Rubroshorea leprosula]|uniref:Uncharacterized protein n=1 Tax=Rubroshorea leprosula TaxID=152421 RepID=A0AAV5MLD6_9ROSI|nr:hypothetical protein SLEP1_g57490 [Rubroshorea leprosula]
MKIDHPLGTVKSNGIQKVLALRGDPRVCVCLVRLNRCCVRWGVVVDTCSGLSVVALSVNRDSPRRQELGICCMRLRGKLLGNY